MTSTDSAATLYTETLISTDHYDEWSTAPNGSARCHDFYTVETWHQTWRGGKYAGYTYKIVRRYLSSSPDRRGQNIASSSSFRSGPEPVPAGGARPVTDAQKRLLADVDRGAVTRQDGHAYRAGCRIDAQVSRLVDAGLIRSVRVHDFMSRYELTDAGREVFAR